MEKMIMKKFYLFLTIISLFAIPLFAQTIEDPTLDENQAIDSGQVINAEDIIEEDTEAPVKKENFFRRLFGETRRPIIKTDNLIFGLPQFLNVGLGVELGYKDAFWAGAGFMLDYTAGPLKLVSEITFKNDRKYAPAAVMIPSGNLGGFYFMLDEGGIKYDTSWLHIAAGRFRNYDEVDSPYSLFINSMGLSANTLKLRVESNHFIYQTQWIGLNRNNGVSSPAWNEYQRRVQAGLGFGVPSGYGYNPGNTDGLAYGFPDRGVNYKIYALKIKDWRMGFLDAAVYSGRAFDIEYLLSPIPMYFTQYFRTTSGRPWATEENDNSLMGLFWDIKKDNWNAYAQALVDDFSLGFLRWIYDGFSRNPWKAAWALGGGFQTKIGHFSFHHGGALKYTFQPIGTTDGGRYKDDSAATAYGYTYYPETRYYDDDRTVSILLEDMMVGYKYGENNLAFQVEYFNTFRWFTLRSELEFVLAGNNSPANPWHDYDSRSSMYNNNINGAAGGYGSQLFNDGQIEKKLEFRVNISRRFGPLTAYAAMGLGGRFNMLELQQPEMDTNPNRTVDDDIWIWKASDKHKFIFRFSLGFRYIIPVI